MILGRVCGTVVATVQHPFYQGRKQLIVRAITPDGAFDGDRYVIAVDLVGAEDLGAGLALLDQRGAHRGVNSWIFGTERCAPWPGSCRSPRARSSPWW